ncbi:hypothetical protein [Lactovum odontotermitis]
MKIVKEQNKFLPSDIALIAQLTDTDGVFIPVEDYTVSDECQNDTKTYWYDLENKQVCVESQDKLEHLRDIWYKKRQKILALRKGVFYSSAKIPYFLYYNSLNLEHVTQNDILKDEEKQISAVRFIDDLGEDFQRFIDFFEHKSVGKDFDESWDFIIGSSEWNVSKSNVKFLVERLMGM